MLAQTHTYGYTCIQCFTQVPDNIGVDHLSSGSLPVVLTTDIQRSLDMFTPWLHPSNKHPFILVGPEGCGKEYEILCKLLNTDMYKCKLQSCFCNKNIFIHKDNTRPLTYLHEYKAIIISA